MLLLFALTTTHIPVGVGGWLSIFLPKPKKGALEPERGRRSERMPEWVVGGGEMIVLRAVLGLQSFSPPARPQDHRAPDEAPKPRSPGSYPKPPTPKPNSPSEPPAPRFLKTNSKAPVLFPEFFYLVVRPPLT